MTKKNFIALTSLLMITSISVGGGLLKGKKVEQVKAIDSPYSITDSQYEVAFFEQYCTNSTNIIDNEHYSYSGDKPIGVHAIGGNQYGIAGNSSANLKKTNFETNLMGGVNETLTWRFSGMNTKWKSSPNRLYVQLENNSSNWNICNSTSFPQSTSPDEYALGQLVIATGKAKGASLVSTSVIQNIQDMSFYWRSSYSTKVLLCYQLENETEWKVFHTMNMNDSEKIVGNYSGTRGWDTYGYTTFNSSSWSTKELCGANAKIAFVCTEAPTESGNFPLSAILINANNAAVRYLNLLSYHDNVCSDNGVDKTFDLNKGQNDNVHNQDLFQLATERASGDFLAQYSVAGTKTNESTALGLYNHLVLSIPALGSVKTSSARFYNPLGNNKDSTAIMVVTILSVVSVSSIILLVVSKKKKRVL